MYAFLFGRNNTPFPEPLFPWDQLEVFIGAILKPLGRNDYKAISTHFGATPSSKFSAEFVYNFVTD